MKLLKLFFLFPFIACANAQESNIKHFTLDSKYAVQAICDKGIKLNLQKNGKTVFSLTPEDGACNEGDDFDSMVQFDENLYGTGKKGVSILPAYIMTTSSETIYVFDTINNKIIAAGSLPIFTKQQEDGTILYEAIAPYSKVKVVYQFLDNKIVQLRSTALYFEGNICIRKSDDADLYLFFFFLCSSGIIASKNSPVCVSYTEPNTPEIIPMQKCDIKEEEVSDLRE
jgi:hypothetical protein